jgi:hypothetical protein
MCNHCYHKYGRNSYANACAHTDRLAYAKGKCQNCYLNDYNKQKRRMKKQLKGENSDLGVFDNLEGPLKRAKLTLATD